MNGSWHTLDERTIHVFIQLYIYTHIHIEHVYREKGERVSEISYTYIYMSICRIPIRICTYVYMYIYIYIYVNIYMYTRIRHLAHESERATESYTSREVGGWGRDPKKCTGRDWGMWSSTI